MMVTIHPDGVCTYPLGECAGLREGCGQFNVPQSLGLPLQLRRIDRTTAIEATLEGRTVLLTGAQVAKFWEMVEQVRRDLPHHLREK